MVFPPAALGVIVRFCLLHRRSRAGRFFRRKDEGALSAARALSSKCHEVVTGLSNLFEIMGGN